jgi:hypothetical protein
MHRYSPSTAGERLCHYIHAQLDDERAWRCLQVALRPVGSPDRLTAYYRHHAALFLCCKLISAGKSVTELNIGNIDLLATIVEGFPWNHLNSGNRLLRLLSSAVQNSNRPISSGTAKELRAVARLQHQHCYICGITLDFNDSSSRSFYTAEHLWPSSYGGDSVLENLLPACNDCNTKKRNIATWVATDVHSLFVGMNPDRNHLAHLSFAHRYAIFNRAAFSIAIEQQISLKNAFRKMGPWTEPRVTDGDLVADMFNLSTHQELEVSASGQNQPVESR